MNKQVSYAYQHLSRTETLFKGENKNINISVSKNSPVNASLSLDGYKHSMVQIIALTIALKMKTVIVNPPIVSDTYVFIAIINELGGTAKIYNKRLFIDASTICNANIPFFLGKCIHGSMYLCPALLIALGKFEYYGSGGCQIGDSIDSHNRPFSHIASVIESSLPYIEGIVLGGSRARGTHTEDSDIDIGIYYNQESFDLTAINQIATELDDENRNNLVVPPGAWGDWINGGGWLVMNGYHVDLILRDIKRVEQIIKDTEQGIVTANYQTGHPHGYISAMYRGELAISKIQYAKNESLCELKNQAEIYPGALKKSLINFFYLKQSSL